MPFEETTQMHTIAWDGISLQVPEEWQVGAIGGSDEKSGYLRIDGPDMVRVEMNWSEGGKFVDLDKIIDKYLEDTQKLRHKKMHEEITIARDDKALSRGKLHKSGVKTFSWEGSQKGLGAAWICKKCGKHVFMQVLGEPHETDLPETAERIIASIRDHPEDDWVLWSVYDFGVELPKRYRPVKERLLAGQVELTFKHESEAITVSRWGLANVALRTQSLEDWARMKLWKQIKQYGPRSEPDAFHGHDGLRVVGDNIMIHNAAQRFINHVRAKLYADRVVACIWHCPQENKIFVVQAVVDIQNKDLADQIAGRITCH